MRLLHSTRAVGGLSLWKSAIFGLAFSVLCGAIVFLALDARKQSLRQASVEALRLSESVARDLAADIDTLDRALQSVAQHPHEIPKDLLSPTRIGANSALRSIYILDQTGRLVAGSRLQASRDGGVSSDDEVRHTTGLSVSFGPTSKLDGRPVLRLSRRIDNPNGSFGGVAVGAFLLPYFPKLRFERWPGAALVLWRDNGQALIQAAGRLILVDQLAIPNTSTASIRADGEYQGKLTTDDPEQLIHVQRLGKLPISLAIALPLEDIYAGWQLKAIAMTIVLVIFFGIAVTLALSLNAELRQRTLAEDALAASMLAAQVANQQLTLSEKIARLGHWRLTLATGELTWSDETYRIHGVDRADFAPTLETSIAAYHVDDRAEVRSTVEQTILAKGAFEVTLRIVTPDGDIRHVTSRGLCELDEASNVSSLFGTFLDVSDVRKAENALRESEARYRLLAETTSDVITRLDLEFKRTYVSPACRTLLGFEPEELIGKRPSDSVHPDDVFGLRELARVLMAGETAEPWVRTTYRTRHKSGHWVWVEAGMSVGHDKKTGQQNALICSLRDVTERREAETAIEASEARFRLLAENTSELIMLGHDDGRRSYISPASVRLLGFQPDELGAMGLRDYVHPEDLDRLFAATRCLSGSQAEATLVFRARHKTQCWVSVEGIFRHVPQSKAGEPTIVATFRDVSEREAQSEALRTAKEAAERSQLAAEHANQAKSEFLASMSHEIRTPLNAILGYTDLLLEGGTLGASERQGMERVQSAGSALLTVVNDILDISKIEAGQVGLETRAFALGSCVENAVAMIDALAKTKHLSLSASVDPATPAVLVGDEDRLRQILLNLLNNAVKFTPLGSVRLTVNCVALDRDQATLRFAVRDTGIGIPADKRSRLFRRFSQVDSSIAREFGGTGLGLSISKSLVKMMGGEIGVEDNSAGGSTFWFSVPLPIASPAQATPTQRAVDPTCSRSSCVLLVEDIEINQELARSVIEAAGHKVHVVSDGMEAIKAVQEAEYDVVLMDVQMPRMDGIMATKHIRALNCRARNVPIIAMTANVLSDQVASYRAAGMNDFIGKPFKRAELYRVIARWTTSVPSLEAPTIQAADRRPAFDQAVYDELREFLEPAELAKLVGAFAIELDSRLPPGSLDTMDRAQRARTAHAMISAAGSLGFYELSALCVQLEKTSVEGGEAGALIRAVEEARERASATLRNLQHAA